LFVLCHIFIPLLCLEIFRFIRKSSDDNFQRFWLIIGSMLPDLIDKPLSLIFGLTGGRGYAHTPILLIFFSGFIFVITRKKKIALSLLVGSIFHLILDIPEIPWLWPLIPIEIYESNFTDWIYTLIQNPVIYISEILSLGGLFLIIIKYKVIFNKKFVHWNRLHFFLFEIPSYQS
jgi:hypothetical protein